MLGFDPRPRVLTSQQSGQLNLPHGLLGGWTEDGQLYSAGHTPWHVTCAQWAIATPIDLHT